MIPDVLLALVAGLLLAAITTPVGVSGAVFLLPVQLSVLHVPSPAVTPTNLLYNVVAVPGALLRYRRQGQLAGPLVRTMLAGAVPGVAIGAVLRVLVVSDAQTFRLIAGLVLLPLGLWLLVRDRVGLGATDRRAPGDRLIAACGVVAGVVGGLYGIGGGSLLGPFLVSRGLPVRVVAPAALASTFVTSVAGCLTYLVLAAFRPGVVAPNWTLGIACGVGGLVGGQLGARLQPRLPERLLTLALGVLAAGLGVGYVLAAVG